MSDVSPHHPDSVGASTTSDGTRRRFDMAGSRRALRGVARSVALDALWTRERLQGRVARSLARPRVHFLYLHSVPVGEEHRLRQLLNALSREHSFVSYSRAVELLGEGDIDRPYVCLSFDDGFASNVRTASIIAEHGASACFFIPPEFIGCPDAAGARRFFRAPDVDERAMTWDEVEHLLRDGHEIGNHTRHHPDVAAVPAAQLEDEIAGSADDLESRLGQRPEHFAWPLGRFRHFTDAAASIVFDSGHRTCASAERGAHVTAPAADRYCLRRDHLMTSWPLRHMLYFIARSAASASARDNDWPSGWQVGSG